MIVNKCIFIGSGQSVLAFCYEMEDDMEPKGDKEDLKKETEKICSSFDELLDIKIVGFNSFPTMQAIHFAEGHPSQPDLPPEL